MVEIIVIYFLYLMHNQFLHNFYFIDNTNISLEHLASDGVHLNDEGTIRLANNFLDVLNEEI